MLVTETKTKKIFEIFKNNTKYKRIFFCIRRDFDKETASDVLE